MNGIPLGDDLFLTYQRIGGRVDLKIDAPGDRTLYTTTVEIKGRSMQDRLAFQERIRDAVRQGLYEISGMEDESASDEGLLQVDILEGLYMQGPPLSAERKGRPHYAILNRPIRPPPAITSSE